MPDKPCIIGVEIAIESAKAQLTVAKNSQSFVAALTAVDRALEEIEGAIFRIDGMKKRNAEMWGP